MSSQSAQHAKWTYSCSGKYNCGSTLGHASAVFVCLFDGELHTHVDGPFLYVHSMKVNRVDFFLICISS